MENRLVNDQQTHKLGSGEDRLKRIVRGSYTSIWTPSAVVLGLFVLGPIILYWYLWAKSLLFFYAWLLWLLLFLLAYINLLVAAGRLFMPRSWIKGIILCIAFTGFLYLVLLQLIAISLLSPAAGIDLFGEDIVFVFAPRM